MINNAEIMITRRRLCCEMLIVELLISFGLTLAIKKVKTPKMQSKLYKMGAFFINGYA